MLEQISLPNSRQAGVAELADAHDSKSCGETHESSILSSGIRVERSGTSMPESKQTALLA